MTIVNIFSKYVKLAIDNIKFIPIHLDKRFQRFFVEAYFTFNTTNTTRRGITTDSFQRAQTYDKMFEWASGETPNTRTRLVRISWRRMDRIHVSSEGWLLLIFTQHNIYWSITITT